MKTLIIGGCGHIGSALSQYFRKHGMSIDTVDAELRGNPVNPANLCQDYRTLTVEDLAAYDHVIWLAGHSSVKASADDPHGAVANNLTGLIELAQKLTYQSLIYASSGSVYSKHNTGIYDATKRAADEIIPLLHKNTYALRFGTVCGASPNIRLDLMINGMTYDAVTKKQITVTNAHVQRPILGIFDLCRAMGAITRGEVRPGIHNLCSFNSTVMQISHQVAGEVGAFVREEQGDGSYNFTMDCASWLRPLETVASIVASLLHEHADQWRKEKETA